MRAVASQHFTRHSDIFSCPICGGELGLNERYFICNNSGSKFRLDNGIPNFFVPNNWESGNSDVTSKVKTFYEKTPFPGYEDIDNPELLIKKSRKGIFAEMLNKQIPYNIRVLDAGTGTGQLANFLGLAQRYVFGVDISSNSLQIAQKFKTKHQLDRVGFYQMNLFKPVFKEKSFHVVISIGVLHHTSNPFLGFKSLAKLVSDDGYIVIGLYNKYGRITNDLRKIIFNLSGDRFRFLDPNLKNPDENKNKKRSWFLDQYKNPHESKHTIGEVLGWFKDTGFDFVYGIPNPSRNKEFTPDDLLFHAGNSGNKLDRIISQLKLMLNGYREGGCFILIGKKTKNKVQ